MNLNIEKNISIPPGEFWRLELGPRVNAAIRELPGEYVLDEVRVIVSVNDPDEKDFNAVLPCSEGLINWDGVERQLLRWSHLSHAGKALEVNVKFICSEAEAPLTLQ